MEKNNTLYRATGILNYSGINRLVVNIEQDLANYYRSLIPKWIPTNRPTYKAHITVVREHKETIEPAYYSAFWGCYEGEEIEFYYRPIIRLDHIYFWISCFSIRLEEIRREMGMYVDSRYEIPPPPFKRTFHVTIANRKV